jgi:AraC-like DNA-binding protein/quercetin dioxygenase-like cupin family protein
MHARFPADASTFGRVTQTVVVPGIEVSRVTLPARLRLSAHAHRRSQICLVLHGSYQEEIDQRKVALQPGGLVFRPAQVMHSNRVGSQTIRAILIDLEPHALPALQELPLPQEPTYIPPGAFDDVALELQAELERPDRFSPCVVAALIELSAIRLIRLVRDRNEANYPDWYARALAIVREHFAERISLPGLARKVGATAGQVARTFRRFEHRSMREMVNELRLNEARRQLLDGHLTIAEIAQGLGYFDQSHFGRHFRNQFHCSPARFRKAHHRES